MMSKVITVMNMKGGVGKTTVALHLSAGSAVYKLANGSYPKVLVIDYDPQFNLSQSCLKAEEYFSLEEKKKTIYAVLVDSINDLDPYIIQTPSNETPPKIQDLAVKVVKWRGKGSLDLVPSSMDMMYLALGQLDKNQKKIENRFNKFIKQCREEYDLIYIDCHPAGSLLTRTALQNSDHVLIPVTPNGYAIRGVSLMVKFIESAVSGKIKPKAHILFNMAPRTGYCSIQNEIRENPRFSKLCMTQTLKKYTSFADVQNNVFVWQSKKAYSSEAMRNMFKVAGDFIQRIS